MKKGILFMATLTLGMSVKTVAQDRYVVSANVALQQGNLEEAKENIDKAIANPETSEKPKALYTKAQVYNALNASDKYKAIHAYRECAQALTKLAEIKPEYEKKNVDQLLVFCSYYYYNDGVKAYNDKEAADHYTEAADLMKNIVKIRNLNGGNRFSSFEKVKSLDTISANAGMIIANSTYYAGKTEEAIPLLISVKNNPITRSPGIYAELIEAYTKTNNLPQEAATIQEARAAFPDDEHIKTAELNYYIVSGKQDDLTKKLEEEAAKQPDNAEIQISLATAYSSLANPKEGKAPANSAELYEKAEAAFKKSVALKPDNAEYNYYTGVFYYNRAKGVNDEMNAITGSSDADMKKFDALKAKRDGYFEQALPYIEKAYTLYDAKAATLKDNEFKLYKASMQALNQIYLIQNKMDKAEAMKKKMSGK
jgi:thioredoxin-like negative regulator of GroEL